MSYYRVLSPDFMEVDKLFGPEETDRRTCGDDDDDDDETPIVGP